MDIKVDIAEELKKAKSKLLRYSLLISLILLAIILVNVLSVTLSGENYLVIYIIDAVITVLLSWFVVFFFTNIYGDLNSRYRFFKGYDSGVKPVEEVEFLRKSDELCYVNGLYVYPVYVRYLIGLNAQDKVIFTLDNNLSYEMGDKLTISTYQRIIISSEKHS